MIDKNRPYKVKKRAKVSAALESILGSAGLFTAEGEEWRKDRRLVGPFLNKNHVKDYTSSVHLVGGRLIDKWEKTMEKDNVVKINSDLFSATVDVISLVAYAKDVNSLISGGVGSTMGADIKILLEKSIYRIFSPFPFWKIPIVGQYLDGTGSARSRVLKSLKRIVQDYEASSVSKSAAEKKRSFLGKLIMQSKQENTHIDSDRLIGNLLNFFIAGSETTFNTIGSALYQLCID